MAITSLTQPQIVWKQYKIDNTSNSISLDTGHTITGNMVDYQAVQAGQYSPAVCVRPQFSNDTSNMGAIGCVRLWWHTYTATNPAGDQGNPLPYLKWVLKYYVSDCSTFDVGDQNVTVTSNADRCARMLNFLSTSGNVSQVASGKNFNVDSFPTTGGYIWCKSTWSNDTCVSMQPVPFSGYQNTINEYYSQFANIYASQDPRNITQVAQGTATYSAWTSTVFGGQPTDNTSIIQYAIGGDLYVGGSSTSCNVKKYINSNITDSSTGSQAFPYIFFTIKAPQQANAGIWSGWACRVSYIWPYTVSTTTT